MSIPYPAGFDCFWLASDREGRVAALVTGGSGPIPQEALETMTESVDIAVDELPRSSAAIFQGKDGRPDSFLELSQRGLFVFDWSDVHRSYAEALDRYELMATPINPLSIGSLPEALIQAAKLVTFLEVSFTDQKTLDVRRFFACAH